MATNVILWWVSLCAVAALNISAWCFSAVALNRRQSVLSAEAYSARRLQLLLSAVYVFGCAFRSAFPVFDVPRICLHNSWLSSVIVGRSVATVAELCFVAQWALMLHEASRASRSAVGRISSLAVVPLIALAEACSWYSVLTTSNLGHIMEESIWSLTAAMMVTSMVVTWPRCRSTRHPALVACCIVGVVYVGFMLLVDVPMYWSRWIADESLGRHYIEHRPRRSRCRQSLGCVASLARLEERGGLDVALLQRRRLVEYRARSRTGAARHGASHPRRRAYAAPNRSLGRERDAVGAAHGSPRGSQPPKLGELHEALIQALAHGQLG